MNGPGITGIGSATVPRLLIVDDEPENLDLLCRLFRLHNCEVHAAANGTDALRMAGKLKPDLMLMDVMMPDINGRDV